MYDNEKSLVNIDAQNKRNIYVVLGIMMMVDFAYLLLSIFLPEYIAFANPVTYAKWMPLLLVFDMFLMICNRYAQAKSRFLLEIVFLSSLTISRILLVDYIELQSFAIVPYISLYLICSAAFLYESQIFISGLFSQLILFELFRHHQSPATLTVLFITTMLILFAGFFSRNRKNLTELYNQSLADQKKQRESLNDLLSVMDVVVVLLDRQGQMRYYNQAFVTLTGYNNDYGLDLMNFFNRSDLEALETCFQSTFETGVPSMIDNYEIHDLKGRTYHFSIKLNRIYMNSEACLVVTAYDLSKEYRISKVKDLALELNNMLAEYHQIDDYLNHILKKLVDALPYAMLGSVLIHNEDGYMTMKANVGYNEEASSSFRLNYKESFFYRMSSGKRDQPIIINNLKQFSMNGITPILSNAYNQEVISSISSPIIINGSFRGLINLDAFEDEVFSQDDIDIMAFLVDQVAIVLSVHQLKEQVMAYMQFDQLTGLHNRWKLKTVENDVIPHCLRHGLTFGLVMIDLNNLKSVNDNYGHANGDFYIRTFAERLKSNARDTDLLIRIGGDEFVLIYFEISQQAIREKLELVASELREKTSAFNKQGIICNFAYGLVNFPEEAVTMDQLLLISDERMYAMKREMKKEMKQSK